MDGSEPLVTGAVMKALFSSRQQYRALSAGGSSKHINALFGSTQLQTCSRPSLTEYTAAALGKTTETDGQGQTSQLTAKAVRTVKS